MPIVRNTFTGGKMDLDTDERLIQKGNYREANNIKVVNSNGSDVGAIEKVKGNELLLDLNLEEGKTIKSLADKTNGLIYFCVASKYRDLLIEYNLTNRSYSIVLESSNTDTEKGVLSFNKDSFMVMIKIINEDKSKDLIILNDNVNPPRIINIERAKTYGVDGFIEDDISLIKKPPRYAPVTNLIEDGDIEDNNIEDVFLSIAYRYVFLDGEYSALSSYSYYQFEPKAFELDFQTIKNNGMVNSKNAISITFNTGPKTVAGIELVFKEAKSNTLYLIERFNKEDEDWLDNEEKSFVFKNNKKYIALPEDELYRDFDNVPKLAKAIEFAGNRLIFGNYVEGYDLKDSLGNKIKIDYSTEIISQKGINNVPFSVYSGIGTDLDFLNINVNGMDLTKGNVLSFTIEMYEATLTLAKFPLTTFDFIFPRDYVDSQDLAEDSDFIYFVETVMTERFLQDKEDETPPAGMTESRRNYFRVEYQRVFANFISIQAPETFYDNDGVEVEGEWWYSELRMQVAIVTRNITKNLKTNRTYETGLKYMDGYGRASTVLTSSSNSVILSQKNLGSLNQLQMSIVNKPPYWADRYKFVVKQNRTDYHTIYSSIFYTEGLYSWVRLEGDSKDKIKEGDTLIVKSDLGGLVNDLVKVDVLEIGSKNKGFIDGNIDTLGNVIEEEAGFYMKIKPTGIDLNLDGDTVFSYDRFKSSRDGKPTLILAGSNTQLKTLVGYYDTDTSKYVDYPIKGGSRIRIKFRNYESDGYNETYEKSFVVQANYDNFQSWWIAEVKDLGDQESNFTWDFYRRPEDNGLQLTIRGEESGAFFEKSRLSCQIDVSLSQGTLIFETEGTVSESEVFYETEETFDIINGYHQGNIQNQDETEENAIVLLGFFNCFTQGSGNESYIYKDGFNNNSLAIDLRPCTSSIEEYREIRRYADITHSEAYNDSSNYNGLNEFNLSKGNYKDDIDKSNGPINYLLSRDTNLVVFQDDKISYVLLNKAMLSNSDGSSNLTQSIQFFNQQITYKGVFGCTQPESIAINGFYVFWVDAKRGTVLKLSSSGIDEINIGTRNFFKKELKTALNSKIQGAFDESMDLYIITVNSKTIGYSYLIKGWVSFYSFIPENMTGLNNEFVSFKNGSLYLHNSTNTPVNNFYGVQYSSSVKTIFNDASNEDKIYKTISTESTNAWGVTIKTNLSQSTISKDEFHQRESRWFAYTRNNEDENNFNGTTEGIGFIDSIDVLNITYKKISNLVSIGDRLYQLNNNNPEEIGIIKSITGNTIKVNSFINAPLFDAFCFSKKDARIEGVAARGYYMEVTLEDDSESENELFAVNSNVVKSYL